MNKELLKKIGIYAAIVAFFLVLAYAFVPQVLSGKIVDQSDISSWKGMTNEIVEHNAAHPDDPTLWTNSMFGGMPVVTMFDKFEGDWTNPLYKALLWGRRPATYLFVALLGAFLLMLSLGVGKFVAVGGAIAVAFCSYNMQIIQVGHNTKMQAIAFFPWVLAALIFTYKSSRKEGRWVLKTLLGSTLFGLALSFQIKANHPQITWYLACCVLLYALVEFIGLLREKGSMKRFFAASALLLVVGGVGIATNANKLVPTWNYTKYTMRGGSELKADAGDGDGLDLAYATAWSYGIGETPNLLIPNFNGGSSSGKLKADSETAKVLKKFGYRGRDLSETLAAMPLYWGPQPFTAGPMYIGAISLFLFLLGLFLYKGREKWWLLAASVFAIFLGWGSHMMWFTKLCSDVLPMYNKFRTVSMAIIVLQATVPALAFVVLDRIVREQYDWKAFRKAALIAFALTGGFCLICCIAPGIAGDFVGAGDGRLPKQIADSLVSDRASLLRADALRSLILISVAFLLLCWPYKAKNEFAKAGRHHIAAAVICVLVLLDLFFVGKRYLNSSDFVSKDEFATQFAARPVDSWILEDDDPDYRVLDLSVNTFNDAHPSYWHKCIGGYSPAKMQRYQDLIERYIAPEMNRILKVAGEAQTISGVEENFPSTPILNMLNTKYVILQEDLPAVENWQRYGNCWFTNEYVVAADATEEISLLGKTDLRTSAIFREDPLFEFEDEGSRFDMDDIRLESYAANELHYSFSCERDRLVVFSEIWYPGWVATVNGEPLELMRADWTLRAAVVPAGDGEIIMRFEPKSYKTGELISRASSISLLLLLLLSLGATAIRKKEENQNI